MNDDRFSPPTVTIVCELESAPVIVWNTKTDRQRDRLLAWIGSRPDLQELIARALLANPSRLLALLDHALREGQDH